MKKTLTTLALILCLIISIALAWLSQRYFQQTKNPHEPIPPLYTDQIFFLSVIKQVTSTPLNKDTTGLTVPHHLLASNLIAEAFAKLSGKKYNHVILISPDHYSLGKTKISVASRNFYTVFGEIKTDVDLVNKLLKLSNVSTADFFYREHGIEAELPFIKYYFPNTPLVALTIKTTIKQNELDALIANLENNLDQNTLIIQSTDFSHYLTESQANEKDEQTKKIILASEPEKNFSLHQPDNLDSLAAEYLQTSLQKNYFHSTPQIINHRNSQFYTKEPLNQTTSYFTLIYTKD